MADVSKIKLTDNTEYNIKDTVARNNVTQLDENKLDKTSLKNESSTANDEGYSANYLNDKLVSVGTTAPTTGERVWFRNGTYGNEGIYVDGAKLHFDNYSTNEQVIGTWINGKPIYRKVIDITGSVTAQTVSIDHNISNIQEVVDQRCIFLRTGGQYRQLPSTYYGNTNWNGQMYITSTKITLELAISIFEAVRDSYYCKVVIEYTKTTD